MDFITNICCLCLTNNNISQKLSDKSDETTYFEKISKTFPHLDFGERYTDYKLCFECCENISLVYNFNNKCTANLHIFRQYENDLSSKNEHSINLPNFQSTSGILDIKIEQIDVPETIEQNYLDENLEENTNKQDNCLTTAEQVTEETIPEKSRSRYENNYELFSKWCRNKNLEGTSESVLLEYFSELAEQNKSSTLWSRYSMLRAILNIRYNVDISKYAKLKAYLKSQNVGYKAKKSSVFSQEDIDNFVNYAPIEYLPQKVALIIGISGSCKCDELLNMKINDLNFLENRIIIDIPTTKNFSSRTIIISKPEWIEIIIQYFELRKNIESERFFLQMRFGNITSQPFGHNAIGNFPKKIAAYLGLENVNSFTGHCFRRTSASLSGNLS